MTLRFLQYEQHEVYRRGSQAIPAFLGAALLWLTGAPMALASPSDCQTVDLTRSNTMERMAGAKQASFSPLSLTLTRQRDIFGELAPAPNLDATPLTRSTRFARGNGEMPVIQNVEACEDQSSRKNTAVNQAIIKGTGKNRSKYSTQVMRIPTLPYNGRKLVLKTRTMLPDFTLPSRERAARLIGPTQDQATTNWSRIPNLTQGPALGESVASFENHPVFAMDLLKPSFRLPISESFRMNLTTTQALHGGNCANGCP